MSDYHQYPKRRLNENGVFVAFDSCQQELPRKISANSSLNINNIRCTGNGNGTRKKSRTKQRKIRTIKITAQDKSFSNVQTVEELIANIANSNKNTFSKEDVLLIIDKIDQLSEPKFTEECSYIS